MIHIDFAWVIRPSVWEQMHSCNSDKLQASQSLNISLYNINYTLLLSKFREKIERIITQSLKKTIIGDTQPKRAKSILCVIHY